MCACNLDYSKTILFAPSCICWVQGSVKYRTRKTGTFLSVLLLNKINVCTLFFSPWYSFSCFFMFCYFTLQHCPLWINDFAKRALVTINWYKNSEICIFAFIAAVVTYLEFQLVISFKRIIQVTLQIYPSLDVWSLLELWKISCNKNKITLLFCVDQ